MKELKIVCMGDKGTGKTCLMLSYVHTAMPDQYISTAFDHYRSEISLNGTNVGINLWDTGGREDYDKLRGLVLKGAHVILLVYSIDNPMSLQNVRAKWAMMARYHAPEAPVLLVGAKLDIRVGGAVDVKEGAGLNSDRPAAFAFRRPGAAPAKGYNAGGGGGKGGDAKGGAAGAAGAGSGATIVEIGGVQPSKDPPGNRTVIVMGAAKQKKARAKVVAPKLVTVEEGVALSNELRALKYMECSAKTQNGLKSVIDEAIQQAAAYEKSSSKCTIL